MISSKIYRHFGVKTPETVKIFEDGVSYSASENIGDSYRITDLSTHDNPLIRKTRFIAAYLKDWDRLGNYSNNLELTNGDIFFIDFGGTLGSSAQGLHKPGIVYSDAIGSFEATTDIRSIYGDFQVSTVRDHPWLKVSREDALEVIELFKTLTDREIEAIVKSAHYEAFHDEQYMIEALEKRRDGMISGLIEYFPSSLSKSRSGLSPALFSQSKLDEEILELPKNGEITDDIYATYDVNSIGRAIVNRIHHSEVNRSSEYAGQSTRTSASNLIVFFDSENIASIKEKGVLNQHESGTSNGALSPELRRKVENNIVGLDLGYSAEAKVLRPKSAYVNDLSDHPTFESRGHAGGYYGNVGAVLNNDVKERSLWVSGDALGLGKNAEISMSELGTFYRSTFPVLYNNVGFREALTYGEIKLKNISAFVLDPSKKYSKETIQQLNELGKPVYYYREIQEFGRTILKADVPLNKFPATAELEPFLYKEVKPVSSESIALLETRVESLPIAAGLSFGYKNWSTSRPDCLAHWIELSRYTGPMSKTGDEFIAVESQRPSNLSLLERIIKGDDILSRHKIPHAKVVANDKDLILLSAPNEGPILNYSYRSGILKKLEALIDLLIKEKVYVREGLDPNLLGLQQMRRAGEFQGRSYEYTESFALITLHDGVEELDSEAETAMKYASDTRIQKWINYFDDLQMDELKKFLIKYSD